MPKPSSVCTSLDRRHSMLIYLQLAVLGLEAEADVSSWRRHDR